MSPSEQAWFDRAISHAEQTQARRATRQAEQIQAYGDAWVARIERIKALEATHQARLASK